MSSFMERIVNIKGIQMSARTQYDGIGQANLSAHWSGGLTGGNHASIHLHCLRHTVSAE
jgi:hypothetical protein